MTKKRKREKFANFLRKYFRTLNIKLDLPQSIIVTKYLEGKCSTFKLIDIPEVYQILTEYDYINDYVYDSKIGKKLRNVAERYFASGDSLEECLLESFLFE